MIHVGDNTWNLRVMITDLQVEKTLRVKGDLHIGGVMLKLSKTEGECHARVITLFWITSRISQSANLFHDPNIFRFSLKAAASLEKKTKEKKFKKIHNLSVKNNSQSHMCVLVVVLVLSQSQLNVRVFHHHRSRKLKKIVGEIVRLRHVQGQRQQKKEVRSVNKAIKSIDNDKKFPSRRLFVNDVICITIDTAILPFAPTQLQLPNCLYLCVARM